MKKYIDTIEKELAFYRAALREACEYFQDPLMNCPYDEDYELVDNETHNCYACKYFGNFRLCAEEQEEAGQGTCGHGRMEVG